MLMLYAVRLAYTFNKSAAHLNKEVVLSLRLDTSSLPPDTFSGHLRSIRVTFNDGTEILINHSPDTSEASLLSLPSADPIVAARDLSFASEALSFALPITSAIPFNLDIARTSIILSHQSWIIKLDREFDTMALPTPRKTCR